MKNVLIVSEAFLNGGLETRVQEEVAEYRKHRCKVFLACHNFNKDHRRLFNKVLMLDTLLRENDCIDSRRLLSVRDKIVRFCQKNAVDHIECHPFFCVLPAALAAEKLNVPITYTLHGVASANFVDIDSTGLYTLYYMIIKYGVDQIVAVAEYLQKQYAYLSPKIIIARNGIKLSKKMRPARKTTSNTKAFCIASRIDAPKSKIIMDFLPKIHGLSEVKKIDIYGDGDSVEALRNFVEQRKMKKVNVCGWVNDVSKTIVEKKYDAIFGMGRVVLNALSVSVPVGVLGYGGFAGFVRNDNIAHFAENNFTDWDTYDDLDIKKEIKKVQKSPQEYKLTRKEMAPYDSEGIWKSYFEEAKSIARTPKPVVQKLNKIFEKNQSENLNLGFMFNEENFPTVSNDATYQLLCNKNSRVSYLEQSILDINNSRFWRLTKPIRILIGKLHH